jgi:hypothetical protein
LIHPDLSLYFAIISHKRPQAVPEMTAKLGCKATWYVDTEEERKAYAKAGAKRIHVGTFAGIGAEVAAKNQALEDAWSKGCTAVIMADDLRRFAIASQRMVNLTPVSAALIIKASMDAVGGVYLGGGSSNSNPYMTIGLRTGDKLPCKPRPLVSLDAFVLGDFMVVKRCGLYFDARVHIKNDYQYTLKHLRAYGKVLRCNYLMQDFRHKTNPGGANERRPSGDERDIEYLMKLWPGVIQKNTKRGITSWGPEIRLRWNKDLVHQLPPAHYPRMPLVRFPRK